MRFITISLIFQLLYTFCNCKRRVLVIHAHPSITSFSNAILTTVKNGLSNNKCVDDIRVRSLYCYRDNYKQCYGGKTFNPVMDTEERYCYNLRPLVKIRKMTGKYEATKDDLKDAVNDLQWCNSIVFVYPTWWFGLPAILKGYFDRVFLPGLAFHLPDEKSRFIVGGLKNIEKIGIVSTYGSSWLGTVFYGDSGKTLISRCILSHCSPRCKFIFDGLYDIEKTNERERRIFLERVFDTYMKF